MNNQILIAIGREYGSDGHRIAQTVAAELGIGFYDQNMLSQIYGDDIATTPEKMEAYDEKPSAPFLSRHVNGMTNSIEENVARREFEFLKEKAASGESFVAVGRCADEVLKDYPGLVKIFIMGDLEDRVRRAMEREGLSEKDAREKIEDTDAKRRKYHNQLCKSDWGEAKSYDLCISVTPMGPDKTCEAILAYVKSRIDCLQTQ